ncbi:hypothetical protein VTI74DRAFT_2055 [Chaetomium olivicolor]
MAFDEAAGLVGTNGWRVWLPTTAGPLGKDVIGCVGDECGPYRKVDIIKPVDIPANCNLFWARQECVDTPGYTEFPGNPGHFCT